MILDPSRGGIGSKLNSAKRMFIVAIYAKRVLVRVWLSTIWKAIVERRAIIIFDNGPAKATI